MRTTETEIDTRGRLVSDITDRVQAFAAESSADGLLHVFLPHATAGLALMETGSGSEDDLAEVISQLLPKDDRYRHRHGSRGHGADHLLPTLIGPSLTLAVQRGKVVLGTWQSIVVVDANRENSRRRIVLSMLEG
ncbi:MAG TPA: secondary thiamine-phosphate synthase enzyme YjbQ [Actinomycetota bacterium]